MPSFDIVSTFNIQEVDNAINITIRELQTRYDLKNQQCSIQFNKNEKTIILEAANEMALKAVADILRNRSINRGISIKIYNFLNIEPATGMTVRQHIQLQEGISKEQSKKINTFIKKLKIKVQSQIQGEQLRITGKKIDDLQQIIAELKKAPMDIHLDFVNFKK